MRSCIELNTLEENDRLYHNPVVDSVEALIPNPFDSAHAADLLDLLSTCFPLLQRLYGRLHLYCVQYG